MKQNENFDVKGPFEALLGHFNVLLLHASLSELDNGALFSSSGTSKFSMKLSSRTLVTTCGANELEKAIIPSSCFA